MKNTSLRETSPPHSNAIVATAYLVSCATLLWPAIVNGQYIWFFDSLSYLSAGSSAIGEVLGIETKISEALANRPSEVSAALPHAGAGPQPEIILGGRSVYYGALLYVSYLLGSIWNLAIIQAACLAATIYITCRACGASARAIFPFIVSFIGLFTSASFFASYVMPDIYASISVLAVASILSSWPSHRKTDLVFLWVMIYVSGIFHLSHMALAVSLICATSVACLIAGKQILKPALFSLSAVALGILSTLFIQIAVEAVTKAKIVSPPFLMMRSIADGPGQAFLAKNCPDSLALLCENLDALPQTNSDILLWSAAGEGGLYTRFTNSEKILLSEHQIAFIVDVLKQYPLQQITASTKNFFEQLTSFDVTEFTYSDGLLKQLETSLPLEISAGAKNSLLGAGDLRLDLISIAHLVVVILSLIVLVSFCISKKNAKSTTTHHISKTLMSCLAIIVLGVILNAMITGMLSMPHDRYQSRVIWLIPFCAAVLISQKTISKRSTHHDIHS